MSTVTRKDQAVMYQLESTVLEALEAMIPGESENLYKTALMAAQQGGDRVKDNIFSRTSYFLTLSPSRRIKELGSILDTLNTLGVYNNPLKSEVFEPFNFGSEYPPHKW